GQVFQHRQGPRPETRTGTLARRRAGRHSGQAQRGRRLRPHRFPGLLPAPRPGRHLLPPRLGGPPGPEGRHPAPGIPREAVPERL
ncbi:phage shock protein C, PspC, partial [Arthrobacter sp. DR-2P]